MQAPPHHYLPRLERRCYQSFAVVHWSMKVEPSAAGWLDDSFHFEFRALLLHACARQRLFCPVYCLMPDHLHLVWMGVSVDSDQLSAVKFLRLHINRLLGGEPLQNRSAALSRAQPQQEWKLQPQAYDHVLREEERKQNAFSHVCFYIMANPVRANLAGREADWPFSGAVVQGYPDLYPMQEDFWELFWRLYWKHREPTEEPAKRI